MAYIHKVGDIFDTTLTYIGQGVNLQSDMSGGIARIIAQKWPALFDDYVEACENEDLQPGSVLYVAVERNSPEDTIIANLASQILPGANARMSLLEDALKNAIHDIKNFGDNGLAVPRIGAGIGGLEWEDVKALFERLGEEAGEDFTLEIWSVPEA